MGETNSVSAVSMFKSTNVHAIKPEENDNNEKQKKVNPFINSVFTAAAYNG